MTTTSFGAASAATANTTPVQEALRSLALLIPRDSVTELRILQCQIRPTYSAIVSGYFTDLQKLAQAALQYNQRAPGIYVTINPVLPALLARADNRVIEGAKYATTDSEILRRARLLFDFDPARPAGISASEQEHEAALARARDCRTALSGMGWPAPILADSGNGAHLIYACDLPNDPGAEQLVVRVLATLASRFSDDVVHVDQTPKNAARISKVYGTWTRKGDNVVDRPHRLAHIIEAPEELCVVDRGLLETFAPEVSNNNTNGNGRRPFVARSNTFDLERWLQHHADRLPGLGMKRPFDGTGWKQEFMHCPWNAEHTSNSAFIGQRANGAIVAACQHNSCSTNNWSTLKQLVGDNTTGKWGMGGRASTAKNENGAGMPEAEQEELPQEYSHDALAVEFVERYGASIRYCEDFGKYLHYQNGRWEKDRELRHCYMSRMICRAAAARYMRETPNAKKNVARTLEAAATAAGVLAHAKGDPALATTHEMWDTDTMLFNTPGGTVDLRTGELRRHNASDYITKMGGVTPLADWRGKCPVFTEYIDRSCAGDGELISFLKRLVGYFLTGETKEHKIAFIQGPGGSGKSTFWNLLMDMMADYARRMPTELLTESGPGGGKSHPTEQAGLHGCRLAIASEVPANCRWNEQKLQELSGGDVVTARFMRQDFFDFKPKFKMLIACNPKPMLRSVGNEMRRRLLLIPFGNIVPENQIDLDLPAKLKLEWPAILAWAIEGCLEWQDGGLRPPAAVLSASGEYFESQDHLGNWLKDRCLSGPQCADTKVGVLFEDYKQYCEAGSLWPRLNLTQFGEQLPQRGYQKNKRSTKGITVRNLMLRPVPKDDE